MAFFDKKHGRAMKQIMMPLKIKSISEDGQLEGYGSVFDVVDYYDEIVAPGAFSETLAAHKAAGSMPKMLWQHDPAQPVGVWQSMSEDETGLYVKGQLALETQLGREKYSLLKMKAIDGLSIGFVTRQSSMDEKTLIRTLQAVDLWEVSLVTFPANPEAMIDNVKSIKTLRDFETFLRDAGGFSRSEAKQLASHGWTNSAARDAREIRKNTLANIGRISEILKSR